MTQHPFIGLPANFVVLLLVSMAVVAWGIYQHARDADDNFRMDWERILGALLEVATVLIILWKVDEWVRLLTEGGAR